MSTLDENMQATESTMAPLLKRVFLFLEDGDWQKADEYCERVLDLDPECAEAYVGKLMAELHVRTQDDLKHHDLPFDDNGYFQKALRFADEDMQSQLRDWVQHIKHRRAEEGYVAATAAMMEAADEDVFWSAPPLFREPGDYKDAEEFRRQCKTRAGRFKRATLVSLLIMIILAMITTLFFIFALPHIRYTHAKKLFKSGDYQSAIVIFEKLGDYKDSEDQLTECRYLKAVELMNNGDYEKAIFLFNKLVEYKDSAAKISECEKLTALKNSHIGDYVFFGTYEQDNDTANGKEDIEWLVLEVKDGKALLISRHILDCKPYSENYATVTWENCTLRTWLNREFITTAFTVEEQAMIPTITVPANTNPEYDTNPGTATQDQVFLLSITEANTYFSSNDARQCAPTEYAVANGAYWWLRSPGDSQYVAAYVTLDGDVVEYGRNVRNVNGAVRPALWINLNA